MRLQFLFLYKLDSNAWWFYLRGDFRTIHLSQHFNPALSPRRRKNRKRDKESNFFFILHTVPEEKYLRKLSHAQTFTGNRASIAMPDVRLLCDTEFVEFRIFWSFLESLLRDSSQTFSTPLPLSCICWFACKLPYKQIRKRYKSAYRPVTIILYRLFIITHLTPPDKLLVPLWPSSITLFSCLLVSAELCAVWCLRLAVKLFPKGLCVVKYPPGFGLRCRFETCICTILINSTWPASFCICSWIVGKFLGFN